MDSLLANYASSDDEGEAEISHPIPPPMLSPLSTVIPPTKPSSIFSFPPPRTSPSSSSSPHSFSMFSYLPPPKSQLPNYHLNDDKRDGNEGKPLRQPPSSIFTSLPPPKASSSSTLSSLTPKSQSGNSNNFSLDQNPKKVVHITIPLNPSMLKSQDSDEDDDNEEKRRNSRKDYSTSSTPKALFSILPAPKNSLCIAPAQSLGASRRSSLHADAPSASFPQGSKAKQEAGSFANYTKYGTKQGMTADCETFVCYTAEQGVSDYDNYTNDDCNWTGGVVDHVTVGSVDSTYASNPATTGWEQVNGNSVGYGSYMDNWSYVSGGSTTLEVPDIGIITGKRRKTDIPTEILEVKQDELMKNRPREDQVKLTGIAFGPAYQAAPSARGKPSKLQKRKHQIGSLYYDLKQKEMELAERRSKGLLTKAETQAKYGW